MGLRKLAAVGRRHAWSVTAAAAIAGALGAWGEISAIRMMFNGSFIAGYLLAAVCGDVLIYAIGLPLLVWLPRARARTAA